MKNWIQISIDTKDEQEMEILIAELSEIGFEGFQENVNLLDAFAEEGIIDENRFQNILSLHHLGFSRKIIPEENWNKQWEKDFKPVKVGKFCGVRTDFHDPLHDVKFELLITPKMSFGTGHHPSTFLIIKAMESLILQGKKVLDFGTGTAVLAILAEKAGASQVLAIDFDPWSISNANENLSLNHCSSISVMETDAMRIYEGESFDVILANVDNHVIINELQYFRQHLVEDGVLVCSGLLAENLQEICLEARRSGFIISSIIEKENWICGVLKKNLEAYP